MSLSYWNKAHRHIITSLSKSNKKSLSEKRFIWKTCSSPYKNYGWFEGMLRYESEIRTCIRKNKEGKWYFVHVWSIPRTNQISCWLKPLRWWYPQEITTKPRTIQQSSTCFEFNVRVTLNTFEAHANHKGAYTKKLTDGKDVMFFSGDNLA